MTVSVTVFVAVAVVVSVEDGEDLVPFSVCVVEERKEGNDELKDAEVQRYRYARMQGCKDARSGLLDIVRPTTLGSFFGRESVELLVCGLFSHVL